MARGEDSIESLVKRVDEFICAEKISGRKYVPHDVQHSDKEDMIQAIFAIGGLL